MGHVLIDEQQVTLLFSEDVAVAELADDRGPRDCLRPAEKGRIGRGSTLRTGLTRFVCAW